MKTKEENKKFEELGKKTVELLQVAYADSDISYSYDVKYEFFTFKIDSRDYIVNVNWSSVKAGIRDIANQLLSKEL